MKATTKNIPPLIHRYLKQGLFVLLMLVVNLSPAVAQDLLQARGDSLKLAGDLIGARDVYLRLFEAGAADGSHAYALASTFALHGQFPDSAFHYLDIALQHEDTMGPLYDPDLYFLTSDARWEAVENRLLDRLAGQVEGAFDRTYARHLLQMRMHEWAFRYHIMLAFRELGPASPVLTALSKAMGEHHDANLERLQGLLEEKGWPALSAVGEAAAYAAGNIINHSDLATRQKYLPMLKATCEKGEGDWSRYAHILDRTELELGHPQVYGTQMALNEDTGNYEAQPMIEPGKVNERRAARGLELIEVQLKRFNAAMKRDFATGGS